LPEFGALLLPAPAAAERGGVRSTNRSASAGAHAWSVGHALRLGLRPQPRSNNSEMHGKAVWRKSTVGLRQKAIKLPARSSDALSRAAFAAPARS